MYQILDYNLSWMTFNISLAIIPVFLGWMVYTAKNKRLKMALFIVWLLFVPNTIYLFTDILHLIRDINKVDLFGGVIITLQYIALFAAGLLTFIFSLYPIEKWLRKGSRKKKRINVTSLLIGINFLIGFGMVIGRVHRLNSWDMIVGLEKVGSAVIGIITSPSMISLTILFGLFANFLYFLFKRQTVKYIFKKI